MKKRSILSEIRRQLTNIPSFVLEMPTLEKIGSQQMDHLHKQIEKAMTTNQSPLIFLVGPFGSGKTTQIHHFIHEHPTFNYTYKSFVKVNQLDLAFLQLTNYLSRLGFLVLIILSAMMVMRLIPGSAPLPFLVITVYFFVKNAGNLVYILHEACDNFFSRKQRVVIIEDLERSSLSEADQWALLANLWLFKRTYLISLGYSSNDKQARLKALEYAQKLGGAVVEIFPYKLLNFSMIKNIDADFPFDIDQKEPSQKGDWMSLFTPREMLLVQEQVALKTVFNPTPEYKKLQYIRVFLELILSKLELSRREIFYDEKTRELKPLASETMSPEQTYFITSFAESIAT